VAVKADALAWREMIQTRTFSLSDRSVEPTQPFGFCRSRSNSAAMAGGQADLSAWSLVLSNMVRAIISSAKIAFRQGF
jgi:hypothetical protein